MTTPFSLWFDGEGPEGATPHPAGRYPDGKRPVGPYMPLGFAEAVAQEWAGPLAARRRGRGVPPTSRLERSVRRFIVRHFPQLGSPRGWQRPQRLQNIVGGIDPARDDVGYTQSRLRPDPKAWRRAVERVASGRRYTTEELYEALIRYGVVVDRSTMDAALDELVVAGVIQRRAGVGRQTYPWPSWRCGRCGSTHISENPCYRCRLERCPQCDTCMDLGRMSACTPLYMQARSPNAGNGTRRPLVAPVTVRLPFELTKHQRRTARALAEGTGDALLWAACGAGKTEVTYETIRRTVQAGGRALFAVPRRDAVRQLGRRLQTVFTTVDVVTLYGGAPGRYDQGSVVVATVQQLVRFYRAFDVVILDEADAFPLTREPWLLDVLESALVPGGRWIGMSATPSAALLERHAKGDPSGESKALYVLPARPHGRPLPVPRVVSPRTASPLGPSSKGRQRLYVSRRPPAPHEWQKSRRSEKPGGCQHDVEQLYALVRASGRKRRQVLVFVPSVRLSTIVSERLKAMAQDAGHPLRVDAVYAGDPKRESKIEALEHKRLDVLVTTTVLERGVTFPGVDIVVFRADDERVWDEASLVQAAGRVDRHPDDRGGSVVFLAERRTPAIHQACASIATLNEQARSLGLIDGKSIDGSQCNTETS